MDVTVIGVLTALLKRRLGWLNIQFIFFTL